MECRSCGLERVVSRGVKDTILRLGLADTGSVSLLQKEMDKYTNEEDNELDCPGCRERTACKVKATFDQVRGGPSVVTGHSEA